MNDTETIGRPLDCKTLISILNRGAESALLLGAWCAMEAIAEEDPEGCVRLNPDVPMDASALGDFLHCPVETVENTIGLSGNCGSLHWRTASSGSTPAQPGRKQLPPGNGKGRRPGSGRPGTGRSRRNRRASPGKRQRPKGKPPRRKAKIFRKAQPQKKFPRKTGVQGTAPIGKALP